MDFFLDQLATSYLVRIGFVGAGGGQPKEQPNFKYRKIQID